MHLLALSGDAGGLVTPAGRGLAQVATCRGRAQPIPGSFVASSTPITDAGLCMRSWTACRQPGARGHLETPSQAEITFSSGFRSGLARCESWLPAGFSQYEHGPAMQAPPARLDAAFNHAVLATKFISTSTLDKYPSSTSVAACGSAFPYCVGAWSISVSHGANVGKTLSQTFKYTSGDSITITLRTILGAAFPDRYRGLRSHCCEHGQLQRPRHRVSQRGGRAVQFSGCGARPHLKRKRHATVTSVANSKELRRSRDFRRTWRAGMLVLRLLTLFAGKCRMLRKSRS